MTWPHTIIQSSVVSQLGLTLWHFLWEGLAIAFALRIILAALGDRTPQARYWAACAAMGLLALAPVLTYSFLPATPRASESATGQPTRLAPQPIPNADFEPAAADPPVTPHAQRIVSRSVQASSADPSVVRERASVSASWLEPVNAALHRDAPWLVVAWAVGVLILSMRNLGAWIAVRQLRSLATQEVAKSVEHMATRLSTRLGLEHAVRVLQSARVDSPMVVGLLKPLILLPASVLTEQPAAQIEALLAHELAHVLRNDYLVNLLQCLIETLLFYHPAVWWVSRQIRIEREHCCDDLAIGVTQKRETYVRALAALADVRVTHLVPAASGGLLMPRLRRILGLPRVDAGRSSFWLTGVIGAAVCLLVVVTGGPRLTAHAAVGDNNAPQTSEPIKAGDLLEVSVADLAGPGTLVPKRAHVSTDGRVGVFYMDPVKVAGLTFKQAENAVKKAYADAKLVERAKVTVKRIESADHASVPPGPILPGDEIDLTIVDLIGLNVAAEHVVRIERDGKIALPYLAPIQAAGLDEQAMERQIAKAYHDAHLINMAAVSVLKVRDADPANVLLGPIGPGDLLRISTEPNFKGWWPPHEATFDVRVDAEGKIGMPQAGALKVAGLTAAQATIALGKAMSAPDPRIQHVVWLLKVESGNRPGIRLGPIARGDCVRVTLIQPPANGPAVGANVREVARDGTVQFPFLGKVNVAGMTEIAAQTALEKAYAEQHPGSERVGVAVLDLHVPPQSGPTTDPSGGRADQSDDIIHVLGRVLDSSGKPVEAVDPDDVIGPGDLLYITALEATFRVRVDADGQIGMPEVGAVKVAGMTAADVRLALAKALALPDPKTDNSIEVLKLDSPDVPVRLIQGGDWIGVTLIGRSAKVPAVDYEKRVGQDGTITLGFLNHVSIAGMTQTAAQAVLEKAYAQQHPGTDRVGIAICSVPTSNPTDEKN
jgi:protein involved in polysaccharide export with SLBB domain